MASQVDKGAQNQAEQDSPENVQRVHIVGVAGVPSFWQMAVSLLSTAAVIIGTLGTAGAWYLTTSLAATEAKLSESLTKTVSPVTQKQAEIKMLMGLVVSAVRDGVTGEEQKLLEDAFNKVRYEDVKNLLQEKMASAGKKSLDQLIRDKKVEQVGKTVKLNWDSNRPAQVRVIKSNDPTLDLSKVDLGNDDDDPDPCRSKVVYVEEPYNATVRICETHFESEKPRLELVVITNPNPSEVDKAGGEGPQ